MPWSKSMLRTRLTLCRIGVDLLDEAKCQTLSSLLDCWICQAHLKWNQASMLWLQSRLRKDSHFAGKALLLPEKQRKGRTLNSLLKEACLEGNFSEKYSYDWFSKHVRDRYFFFHFAMMIDVITGLNISHILLTPWLLDENCTRGCERLLISLLIFVCC